MDRIKDVEVVFLPTSLVTLLGGVLTPYGRRDYLYLSDLCTVWIPNFRTVRVRVRGVTSGPLAPVVVGPDRIDVLVYTGTESRCDGLRPGTRGRVDLVSVGT